MSQLNIQKICADSLRTYTQTNYKVKLKASHAHELVAAYFGYNSKNALLADERYSVNRVSDATIFIMVPVESINKRISSFNDFALESPDIYSLGDAVYAPLLANNSLYRSEYPPFRSFNLFAKNHIENSQRWNDHFKKIVQVKLDHIVEVKHFIESVEIVIVHTSKISDVEYIAIGKTTLVLPRVVGGIGFLNPEVKIESWSGQARKHFKLNKRV